MASKRKLKKDIKYVSLELATESLLKIALTSEAKEESLDSILDKISELEREIIARINHSDGKENKKVLKNYYKKLLEDWSKGVDEIIAEIGKIG